MRFLLILTSAFAVLYGGYWFVGSTAATRALTEALSRAEAGGLDVAYEDIRTRGFPSRFDTTLTGISLADPGRGLGWQAPFVQLFALSYSPTHVIIVWPESQTFDLPRDRVTVQSDRLRASLRTRPVPTLPLREATVEGADLAILSAEGWEVDVAAVLAALRVVPGSPLAYEAFAEATGISLPTALLQALGGADVAPAVIERIRLDGRLTLDAPLDRMVRPEAVPRLTALDLRDATLRWGDMSLTGVGALSIDAQGVPEGLITLTVTNWRKVIAVAISAGILDPAMEPIVTRAANALAQGSERLEAPVRFQNGFMSLGPLPLGPAPRLQ
jgi:hypothetical protein